MMTPVEFPQPLLDAFVRGARHAHDIVLRAHVEEDGFDASTFGFNRYRLTWHWIAHECDQLDDVFVLDRTHSLRVRWGRYEFSFYNGGIGTNWNPSDFDFSATPRRAEVGTMNQLIMPGLEPEPAEFEHLLVIYSATMTSGCDNLYIGAPLFNPANGSTSWAWLERIWSAPPPEPTTGDDTDSGWSSFRDLDVDDVDVSLHDDLSDGQADTGS